MLRQESQSPASNSVPGSTAETKTAVGSLNKVSNTHDRLAHLFDQVDQTALGSTEASPLTAPCPREGGQVKHQIEQICHQMTAAAATLQQASSLGQHDVVSSVQEAQAALALAAEAADELSDDDPVHRGLRERLLDQFFALQRIVDQTMTRHQDVNVSVERQQQRLANQLREKVKPTAKTYHASPARHLQRSTKMMIVLSVVIGARIALFLSTNEGDEVRFDVVETAELPDGVAYEDPRATPASTQAALKPKIRSIVLRQTSGGLEAHASATSPKGTTLAFSYTWLQSGQVLAQGPSQTLAAERLSAGASYKVEVSVSDGTYSASVTSDAILFDPNQNQEGQ